MAFVEQFITTNNLLNVFLAVRTSKIKKRLLIVCEKNTILLSCSLNNKSFPIILFEISYKLILIIKIIEKKW